MSKADKQKWNQRYVQGAYAQRPHPSALLAEYIDQIPVGRALDVACGAGRNALFMARQGFAVDAIDISNEALARAETAACKEQLQVRWMCQDLDHGLDLGAQRYQLIVMVRFVSATILQQLPQYLAADGVLLVEQHMRWPEPVNGPQNDRFRVAPGELLSLLPELEVVLATDGLVQDPDGTTAALSRLIVKRG